MQSGENWSSLYAQFLFSWVETMMKEGYRRTLNEDDLNELPPENRAKSVLAQYRKHKSKSLIWSIVVTYKTALFHQFLYCIVWSCRYHLDG